MSAEALWRRSFGISLWVAASSCQAVICSGRVSHGAGLYVPVGSLQWSALHMQLLINQQMCWPAILQQHPHSSPHSFWERERGWKRQIRCLFGRIYFYMVVCKCVCPSVWTMLCCLHGESEGELLSAEAGACFCMWAVFISTLMVQLIAEWSGALCHDNPANNSFVSCIHRQWRLIWSPCI